MANDDTSQIIQTIQGMADKAKNENDNPGPGDVEPSIASRVPGNPLVTLKMEEKEVGQWWTRIEAADTRRKAREESWDILLDEYLPPKAKKSGSPETLKIARHFRDVHTRIGNLFYRSPELILTPKDPGPAQNQQPAPIPMLPGMPPPPPITLEDVISVKQAVLTEKLGSDEIDVESLMDELLFDVLAWSGLGCSKIGYRCTMVKVPKMVPAPPPVLPLGPGPMAGGPPPLSPTPGGLPLPPAGLTPGAPPAPPLVQEIGPDGQPVMEDAPIYEEYYWRRFSPKKALFNADLRSCRFDKDATWTGMWFFMSPEKAKLSPDQGGFGLTDDEVQASLEDDKVHKYSDDESVTKSPGGLVCGVEISCKASIFGGNRHPLALNQLILIKGIKTKPVVWRPSPDQEFDEMGKLTQDSMIGFPFRFLTIRDLADSPFPPSDSAFTNSETKELQTWRQQSIALRNAQLGKYLFDKGAFSEEETEQLTKGTIGQYIGVEDGRLKDGPDKVLTVAAQIHGTADDYRNQELIRRDLDETLGIGANQSGAPEETVRTATETATVNAAVSGRNDKELSRVVKFYLAGVRMIDQLLMRYADQEDFINIVGEDGARRLMTWSNTHISGRYIYDITPDSQIRNDTARDWQLMMNFYNIAAPDPLCNRAYLLRRLARMRGLDPDKVVVKPEQLALSGFPMGAQPPHGGTTTAGDVVNKHQQTNTGGRPNEPMAENHRQTMPM